MSQTIRGQGGHLVFPIGPKNTNLVEDVEILLPVKFRWIPFSSFRGEVENVSANPGLEIHACKLAKCELKFSFASWKYRHLKKVVSSIFQQVYSNGSGKVEAPCNTDSLSCLVTTMAKKIMYFFKQRKEECGRQQVLCHWRGERWTKFQLQETIAIGHMAMLKTVQK